MTKVIGYSNHLIKWRQFQCIFVWFSATGTYFAHHNFHHFDQNFYCYCTWFRNLNSAMSKSWLNDFFLQKARSAFWNLVQHMHHNVVSCIHKEVIKVNVGKRFTTVIFHQRNKNWAVITSSSLPTSKSLRMSISSCRPSSDLASSEKSSTHAGRSDCRSWFSNRKALGRSPPYKRQYQDMD